MAIRWIVSHSEELGDAESGPMGMAVIVDAEFKSEASAKAWVSLQKNPNWYDILAAETDPRVAAIRNDRRVGTGSCTSIDECYGDEELIETLDLEDITTPEAALQWALEQEGLFLEQGLNQRWGEDDDPQLLAYQEWQEKVKE